MRFKIRGPVWGILGAALLIPAAAGGCSTGHSESFYIPAQDKARSALEAALTAWQQGEKPGTLDMGSIQVQVFDGLWRKGNKLESFEITESDPGSKPPSFTVRLKLKKTGVKQVHYVVLGANPLGVYSEDEFKRLNGM